MNKDDQSICEVSLTGAKHWYFNNLHHREDGPAVEGANGNKIWFFHGKLHRVDGPAFEGSNGCKEWYYQGEYINCSSQEEFEKLINLKALW